MENIIDKIRTELRHSIDEKTLATSQFFFKEKIKLYGVKVPTVNKISREYFKLIDCKTKSEIVDYVIKNNLNRKLNKNECVHHINEKE